jgi:hypothetical protein
VLLGNGIIDIKSMATRTVYQLIGKLRADNFKNAVRVDTQLMSSIQISTELISNAESF